MLVGDDPRAYLGKQLVNVAIGLVLMAVVMTTDHRWVRILAPVAYLARRSKGQQFDTVCRNGAPVSTGPARLLA